MQSQFGTRHRTIPRRSSSCRTQWQRTALCAAGLTLVMLRPAHATEGGGSVYPYGLNTVASGVLPKPGAKL